MVIQHNMAALNGQRQLGVTNSGILKNMEKLSSGYKINRSGDDAAGLSISEKMRAQIRGLDMAIMNAQNGISLIQTAEGGLNETHAILQRMRELAVQSANDINSEVDRKSIEEEYGELTAQMDRIAWDTQYNGIHLLNGEQSKTDQIYVSPFSMSGAVESAGSALNGMIVQSIGVDTVVSPGDMAISGNTNWSNINGEDLTWLRDKIVNEIAPSAVSAILDSFGSLDFLKGTDIGLGLYHQQMGSLMNGITYLQFDSGTRLNGDRDYKSFMLALGLDDDLLSNAASSAAGDFSSEEEKRLLYEVIGHELVHAVMTVVTSKGNYSPFGDPFPSWYVEGMAQALTGPGNWIDSNGMRNDPTDEVIRNSTLSQLGNGSARGDYAAGYFAFMYLGYKASGSSTIDAATILSGIDKILSDNVGGESLNTAFLNAVGKTVDEFAAEVRAGGTEICNFVRDLMDVIGDGGGALLGGLNNDTLDIWDSANSESFLKMDPNSVSVRTEYADFRAKSGGGKTTSGQALDHIGDITPPGLSNAKLYGNRRSDGNFDFTFMTDEMGWCSYIIVNHGDPAPDFSTIDKNDPYEYFAVPRTGEILLDYRGLDTAAKDVYIQMVDESGNRSMIKLEVPAYDPYRIGPWGEIKRYDDENAEVSFRTFKAGEYYYAVVDQGAAAPVIDTSGAGISCNTGASTINLTNLTPGAKDVYVVVKGSDGTFSQTIKMEVPAAGDTPEPIDTTAPTLTAGAADRNDDNATVRFTSNEAGQYYYGVVEKGAAAPTIDTTGIGITCGNTEQSISLTGLSSGAKDIYIVVKDAAGNVSNQLKVEVAAEDAVIPPEPPEPPEPVAGGKGLTLQIGANTNQSMVVFIENMDAGHLGVLDAGGNVVTSIKDTAIISHNTSGNAISVLDAAINQVSKQRSQLGAMQNRLEHTINGLGVVSENLANAEAGIRDTNMSDEMVQFVKNNILMQASQAILAQSAKSPQGVLQLLL